MLTQNSLLRAQKRAVLSVAALSMALLTGCTQSISEGPAAQEAASVAVFSHVHGMSVDPDSGRILLATHEGLFDATADEPQKIGPTIDLMGFATGGKDEYYASGHPSTETGLPDPAGLIRSTDGGSTWEPLSLQGKSDFHALAVTGESVIGFDGTLRVTDDTVTWNTIDAGIQPYHLAGSPLSQVVLATTEQGVHRSEDGGKTWTLPQDAPVLLLTAVASKSVAVGVEPDGAVQLSRDAGRTWQETGGVVTGQPAAIAATGDDGGQVRIWVATSTGISHSTDDGATFTEKTP